LTPPAAFRYEARVSVAASRIVFVCYAGFLAGVIYLANHGGGRLWSFLTDIPGGDKLGHLGLVSTLTLLLNLALRGRRAPGKLSRIMLGSLLAATIMTLEELSQAMIPSRSLDLFDGLANLAGVALGEWGAKRYLDPRAKARWNRGPEESNPTRTGPGASGFT
jgi:hypothetical protein